MRILFTDAKHSGQSVANLNAGDLFKLPTGATVYMKLNNPNAYYRTHSVVNLQNGNVYGFEASKEIVTLEGELFVKEANK